MPEKPWYEQFLPTQEQYGPVTEEDHRRRLALAMQQRGPEMETGANRAVPAPTPPSETQIRKKANLWANTLAHMSKDKKKSTIQRGVAEGIERPNQLWNRFERNDPAMRKAVYDYINRQISEGKGLDVDKKELINYVTAMLPFK